MAAATDIADRFEQAAEYLYNIQESVDVESLLYLYARFKQAREGPCNVPKPFFFNASGVAKWEAWRALGQMDRESAMSEYIGKMSELDPSWQNRAAGGRSGWARVSTLAKSEAGGCTDDSAKTLVDWIKAADIGRITAILDKADGPDIVNTPDEAGGKLFPLHWAADHGSAAAVKLLLDRGADINALDDDGQTALHYACSVGYADVVEVLLGHEKLDRLIKDNEGCTAFDVIEDEDILRMFS